MYAFSQLQGLSNSTEELFDWSFALSQRSNKPGPQNYILILY
jgi:hypothetical protein